LPQTVPQTLSDALVTVSVILTPDTASAAVAGIGIAAGEVWQLQITCTRTKAYTAWGNQDENPVLFTLSSAIFYSEAGKAAGEGEAP
jgi:hypothetical protein